MSGHQIRRVDSDDCQIGVRIVSDKLGLVLAGIRKGDLNPFGSVHHVTVSQNETVRSKDETRAAAAGLLRPSRSTAASTPNSMVDLDIDNRWADFFRGSNDCT